MSLGTRRSRTPMRLLVALALVVAALLVVGPGPGGAAPAEPFAATCGTLATTSRTPDAVARALPMPSLGTP